MGNLFRRKKRLSLVLMILFLLVSLSSGFMAVAVKTDMVDVEALTAQNITADNELQSSEVSGNADSSMSEQDSTSGTEDTSSVDTSSTVDDTEDDDEELYFNTPNPMRAVTLVPGKDFFTVTEEGVELTAELVKEQIDTALASVVELGQNTIIIETLMDGKAVFASDTLPSVSVSDDSSFDAMAYIVEQATAQELFVYLNHKLLSVSDGESVIVPSVISADVFDSVDAVLKELVLKYDISGITFDGYYYPKNDSSYAAYRAEGSGIGYDNWFMQSIEQLIYTASQTVKQTNKAVQVGVVTDPVWSTADSNAEGMAVTSDFEVLGDGNIDIKRFIEEKLFHYVIVKNYASLAEGETIPFETVARWWSDLVSAEGIDIPLYFGLANEKIMTEEAEQSDISEWDAVDQLVRQLVIIANYKGCEGAVMNSLSDLVANRDGSTDVVKRYYDGDLNTEHIFRELTIIRPTSTNITTYEDTLVFYGQTDSNFEVYLNEQELEINENGDFSTLVALNIGMNTLVFEHKGEETIYYVNRKVQLIREMGPTGTIRADGGSKITITATAYFDSTVYATVAGTTVKMYQEESIEDVGNTMYTTYTGSYTLPASGSSDRNIGNVVVHATWSGDAESMTGAAIVVNKQEELGEGKLVEVIAPVRAETFLANTADDYSSPWAYPLPPGTLDYIVGDEITYTYGGTTYKYYKLRSGKRVYSSDIKVVEDPGLGINTMNDISVNVSSQFTDIVVQNDWKVPFSSSLDPVNFRNNGANPYYVDSFGATSFSITFDYTDSVPTAPSFANSPLFSSAQWSIKEVDGIHRATLTVTLSKAGRFLGVYSFYDGDNLVIRFNNPAPIQSAGNAYGYTLNGAKIFIDPGHGGSDPGAIGITSSGKSIYERDLNIQVSSKVIAILESLGADVQTMSNTQSTYYSLQQRVNAAVAYQPHIFISVHHNAASRTSGANGVEAFYYNPFSMPLAESISSRISAEAGLRNRGDKQLNFFVTREFNYSSVLVEYGFVSTASELDKLILPATQDKMAQATVQGIIDYLK